MCGIVAEERGLCEQDGESDGSEHLPPRVADPDEQRDRRSVRDRHAEELGPVVAVPAAHHPGILDDARQFGECTGGHL
jgi:hypothetical protein